MTNIECKNCGREDLRFVKGYCPKCYLLVLKNEKLKMGKNVYKLFISNYPEETKKTMLQECVRQINNRLEDIKDSNVLKENVTAHELEYQINDTIRSFGKRGFAEKYGLGKINDYLESNLRDNGDKEFIYQLFAKIKILNRFKLDYYKVYDNKKL